MIVCEHAASLSKAVCFSLGAPFVSALFTDSVDKIIPYTDFVFGTGDEALAYAEARGLKDRSVEAVAKHFASVPWKGKQRNRLIVFTQGSGNIIVVSSEDMHVRTFEVTPLPIDEIVDTNGAGDGFAAGFLANYLVSGCVVDAIEAGKKAACYIIKQSGFSLGPREEYS